MEKEAGLTTISKTRVVVNMIKEFLRHPFLRASGVLGEAEPNVYFGYTDHPLDRGSTAYLTPYGYLGKHAGKKARCVLQAAFTERQGNSFIFAARGYDIYKVADVMGNYSQTYKITPQTPYREMTLRLDFLQDGVYRIRLAEGSVVPENNTPMVVKDIRDPDLAVQMQEEPDCYLLSTSALRLAVYKEHFRIEISDAQGSLITTSGGQTRNMFPIAIDAFPLGFIKTKGSAGSYGVENFVLAPGEAVFGLGEQYGSVNKVGSTIGFWNTEGSGNTSGRNYKHIPFFMSTQGYGVFINESRPITCWVGSRETCTHQIAIEGNLIDYYFTYGPAFTRILNTYTELTGKATVPPKWSFGTWVSRMTYSSQTEVMEVAKKLREMRFPSDVIHIDTGWFELDWRCDWRFDKQRFPDPERMFQESRQMGFRICLWQMPYVIEGTDVYREARKRKFLAKKKGPFLFIFAFPASPIDFSQPEAVAWYQSKLRPLLEMGASTIKVDFGEGVEPSMRFKKYDGRQMHNLYPLLYNKAAFDAVKGTTGEGIIWARSAYAGSQRYPVHWSGDNSATYENMLSCLRGGLSLGLSGFTFWSQDTGGFVGIPTDDLYIRWTQLTAFQSHMRFHGTPPKFREPWQFDPETQRIVRKYLELRYRLIPYLYSEAHVAAAGGLPLLRHLVIDFQNDPTVFNIEDQFMTGRALLVAPILTRNNSRRIYLPAGIWYDFWSGERSDGGRWITREADIETIPVYVRGGIILPLAAAAQCADQLSTDGITLRVYPDTEGWAAGEILDGQRRISFEARQKEDAVEVSVPPGVVNSVVELPPGFTRSEMVVKDN
jgi:alpha-D-xyloside xylohydrolase